MMNVFHAPSIQDGMENTVSATAIHHLGVTVVPLVYITTVQRVVVVRQGICW
jgi:hypothetical protein